MCCVLRRNVLLGLPFCFDLFKMPKLAPLTHVDVIQRLAGFNTFPISFMQKSFPFVKSSNSTEIEGSPFFNFQICFWWRHRKKDSNLFHTTPWLLSTSQRTFKKLLTNRTFWHKSLFSRRCSCLLKTVNFSDRIEKQQSLTVTLLKLCGYQLCTFFY